MQRALRRLAPPVCVALAALFASASLADTAPAAAPTTPAQAQAAAPTQTPTAAPVQTPAAAAAAAAAPAPTPTPIWRGTSAGFDISWTSAELSATDSAGKPVFSAKAIADKDFTDYDNCDATEAWTAMSVVGPLVSVKHEEGATCVTAAHTVAYTEILAIDLSAPAKPPSLADYFSEADLYAALLGDGVVKKSLASTGKPAPKTSAGLLALLADNANECDYRFETGTLTHFAFHHLEKGKVAVRVGLPYNCEAARGKLTQLGFLLPIPAKLKDALDAAAAQKSGFLMKDEKSVGKDRYAQFHLAATPAQ